jgi:plasmid stabilization system protein ParE
MNVVWHPLARAELLDAAEYYEAQRAHLGERFVTEVDRAIEYVRSFPNAWPRVSPLSRRIRTRRFPYGIVYQTKGDAVHILAVMHLHRRPDYWRERESVP